MSTESSDPGLELEDGTTVQLKSVTQLMYLSAEKGGGHRIVAKEPPAGDNEKFILQKSTKKDTYNLKAPKNQLVGLSSVDEIHIVAEENVPAKKDVTLEIKTFPGYLDRVKIKASNEKYVQVLNEDEVTANHDGSGGADSPSVFFLNISRSK